MKKILITMFAAGLPTIAMAQAAVDAARMSQLDLRGTARFVSMGGAFTALGGDITTLNQNPAGIGVFRGNELTLSLNLDAMNTKTGSVGFADNNSKTRFNFQNFGFVGTVNLHSDATPTISFGASYNRMATFDRITSGGFSSMNNTSLSNYIAAMTNSEGRIPSEYMKWDGPYNGYNPYLGDDNYQPSWLSTLAYQGFVINDIGNPKDADYHYQGLGDASSATFRTQEKGYVDEYNISVGGNIYNVVYWGVGVGITDIDYKQYSWYDERYNNAVAAAQRANATESNDPYYLVDSRGHYTLTNFLQSSGTGYNIKLGVIAKPINELRIGFAFHTPTWYKMTDTYWGDINYSFTPNDAQYATNTPEGGYGPLTNDGSSWNDYKLRTPWRMMFGIAGVIGNKAIISADYELRGSDMQVSDPYGDEYTDVSADIKTYYKNVSIFRLGAEYRVTPQLSVRAGYSHQSSPVETSVENDGVMVWTAGTIPSYSFEKTTDYFTLGVGYKFSSFYLDLAYAHRTRKSTWHAYSPILVGQSLDQSSPSASLTEDTNSIYLTFGYKF